MSYYWKAEAYYRLGKYDEAIKSYDQFRRSPSSIVLKEYRDVDYQIGYAYLRMRNYGAAIRSFRTFEAKVKGVNSLKLNDAYLRIGDAYLILSNNLTKTARKNELIHATNYYNKAIKSGLKEVDYAYYQLGQSYKLLNKYELSFSLLAIDLYISFIIYLYKQDVNDGLF